MKNALNVFLYVLNVFLYVLDNDPFQNIFFKENTYFHISLSKGILKTWY